MRGVPLALVAALLVGCQDPAPVANKTGEANRIAASPPATAPAAPAPPAPPRTGPWSATGYALTGSEPFWGGTVTGTAIRYMVPEDQFGRVIETRATYAADRETYAGDLRGRPFVLTLTASPCSDGMSDHRYAFTASLEVEGETRRGCADAQ